MENKDRKLHEILKREIVNKRGFLPAVAFNNWIVFERYMREAIHKCGLGNLVNWDEYFALIRERKDMQAIAFTENVRDISFIQRLIQDFTRPTYREYVFVVIMGTNHVQNIKKYLEAHGIHTRIAV